LPQGTQGLVSSGRRSILSDRYFAPEEKANLDNLARTFGLGSEETLELHGEAFDELFQHRFPDPACSATSLFEEKGREIALLTRLVPLAGGEDRRDPEARAFALFRPACRRHRPAGRRG
jgi:hypothetical protein